MDEQTPNFEVTKKLVEEAVVQEIFIQAAFKTTVCVLILNTGSECVGVHTQNIVSQETPVDIAEGKKKAKKAAMREAAKAIQSVSEWRKAVYESQKAQEEAQKQAAAQAQGPTDPGAQAQ